MSQYHSINAGETERFFTVVARASGAPITSGTVNYYLKAKSGANAGKWWKDADQTWDVAETANAMTHDADGHWEIDLTSTPFADGVRCLEYVKESGDLHVPQARHLIGKAVVEAVNSTKIGGQDATAAAPITVGAYVGGTAAAALETTAQSVKAKTDGLNFTGTDVKATLDGEEVTPTAASKTGYALISAYDAAKTAAAAGAAMALTSGERTTLAAAIEAAIINELDGTAVMQAIADLIASDMTTTDLTVAAIASAVRDAILNRVLSGNHDTAGTPGKLLQDASTFDPATDTVARVTLVDTTTTNTDMRGTDGALTTLGTNAPEDWLNAAAVKADAVTKIQDGLSTYAGADTAGTTTLLSRVVGTILAGNHTAQSGDAYDYLGTNLGLLGANATALAPAATALSNVTWTDEKAGHIDAAITSRGTSTHAAADVAALILATPAQKLVTDASGYVTYSNDAPPSAETVATQVRTELTTELATLAKVETLIGTV